MAWSHWSLANTVSIYGNEIQLYLNGYGAAFLFLETALPKIGMALKIIFECLVPKNICRVCVILNNCGCKHLVQYQLSQFNQSTKKCISLKMNISIFGMGVFIYGTKGITFLEMFPKMDAFLKMILRYHSVPDWLCYKALIDNSSRTRIRPLVTQSC